MFLFSKILLCVITFSSTVAVKIPEACLVENEDSIYYNEHDDDSTCDFAKITCSDIGSLTSFADQDCDSYCSELNLSNTSIINFNANTIPIDRTCGLLIYLELTYTNIETITDDAFLAFPKIQKLTLAFNKITHLEFLDYLIALKELNMQHNKLIQINAKNFRHLRGLKSINIAHNDLTTIGNLTYNMEDLREFHLNHNDIVEIEEHVFQKLQSLRILNLSNNKIKLIKKGTFEGLTSLAELYLQENGITLLESYSFNAVTNLKIINLSKNVYLNQISQFTFKDLGHGVNLNLSRCNISYIEPNAFVIDNVEYLDLSNNKLSCLENDIFLRISSMNKLFLENNPLNLHSIATIFNQENKINSLDLSGCKVTILKANFLMIKDIKSLKITATNISSIDPLTFTYCNSLLNLDLGNNRIQSVQSFTFSPLINLQTLDLSKNSIMKIFENALDNLQNLRSFRITGINLVLEDYSFKNLNKLENLEFVSSKDLQLKSKCFSHSNNLHNFKLTNTTIRSIDTDAFFGIPALPESNLCQNRVENVYSLNLCNVSLWSVASNAFNGTITLLQSINLNNNNIEVIPTDTFKEMTNLLQINMEATNISFINSLAFSNLKFNNNDDYFPSYDRGIYLSFNNIKKITHHAFSNIVSLDSLNLSFSKIRNIESFSFSNLSFCGREDCNGAISLNNNNINIISNKTFTEISNVKVIDLGYNKINELDSNIFNSVTFCFNNEARLKNSINLNNNLLTNLKSSTFDGLKNVQELHLEHNKINKLEENVFNGLSMMKTVRGDSMINLSENRLIKLSKGTFNGVYNLGILNINHNLLATVEPETFLALTNLTSLDLSYNNLTVIEDNTFLGLHNLSWLSLANNNLPSLSSESFAGLISLNDLLMSKNNIEDFPLGTFQNFLMSQNVANCKQLGHNRLSIFNTGNFSNLGNLMSLNLSRNNLVALDETTFYPLHNLTLLNLDNNRLSAINYLSLLTHLTKLRYISVNDNNWTCKDLLKMLTFFKRRNVEYLLYNATRKFTEENIDGISCNEVEEYTTIPSKQFKTDKYSNKLDLIVKFFSSEKITNFSSQQLNTTKNDQYLTRSALSQLFNNSNKLLSAVYKLINGTKLINEPKNEIIDQQLVNENERLEIIKTNTNEMQKFLLLVNNTSNYSEEIRIKPTHRNDINRSRLISDLIKQE